MRNRIVLGKVKEFRTKVLPNRASFFALTSKVAPSVKVQFEKKGTAGLMMISAGIFFIDTYLILR
jgi:hypothetical protein